MGAALLAAPLAALGTAPAPAAGETQQKPNIVVIISDDQGWKDVGFHGSDIKTPNIDALAAGGARLEQFYSQPMCSPTRAALMTGRYPFRYGLQIAIPSAHDIWAADRRAASAAGAEGGGLRDVLIGKWHLGHADHKYWPIERGFDHHYGPLLGEIDYFTHAQHGVVDWFRDGRPVKEPGYSTTLLGDAAVARSRATTRTFRSFSTSRSTRRMRPIRRRPPISTATPTSPTRPGAPTRRRSPRWTMRSAGWSRRSTRRACATTR